MTDVSSNRFHILQTDTVKLNLTLVYILTKNKRLLSSSPAWNYAQSCVSPCV